MTAEDYLLVMEQNIEVYPEWDKLTDEQKRHIAAVNISTGTAQSFFEDGRLVGVGGIRFRGIGEAWLITPPYIRDHRAKSLFREARRVFKKNRDELNLWRIFATSRISKTFLRHLGFKRSPRTFCWMRTEERRPNGNER
jgi:hypothetical protein